MLKPKAYWHVVNRANGRYIICEVKDELGEIIFFLIGRVEWENRHAPMVVLKQMCMDADNMIKTHNQLNNITKVNNHG